MENIVFVNIINITDPKCVRTLHQVKYFIVLWKSDVATWLFIENLQ